MKAIIYALIALVFCQNLRADPTFKEIPEEGIEVKESAKAPEAEVNPSAKKTVLVQGVPRMLRKMDQTEVFFKDVKESYFIPSGSSHNKIMNAMTKGIKNNSSVSFRANPVSHYILELNEKSSDKSTPVKSETSKTTESTK